PTNAPTFPYTTLFRSRGAGALPPDARRHRPAVCARTQSTNGAHLGPHPHGISGGPERHHAVQRLHVGALGRGPGAREELRGHARDRKSTRLNSSHVAI